LVVITSEQSIIERGPLRSFLGALVAAVCVLALVPVSAMATPCGFCSIPSSDLQGVAVNQESGDVYVVDSANAEVDEFTSQGQSLRTWGTFGTGFGELRDPGGIAVDNSQDLSQGDVFVEDIGNNRIDKFSASGAPIVAFGQAGNGEGDFEALSTNTIAIGPTGTVYVGDQSRIEEFSDGGVFEKEILLAGVGNITALTVDENGNLHIEASGLTGVHKYQASGKELGVPHDASGLPGAITAGPGGELFVEDSFGGRHHILEYNAAGDEVESFDSQTEAEPRVEGSRGVALGAGSNDLYVVDKEAVRVVTVPSPGPLLISASESPAMGQCFTLQANVNPEGTETTVHFEYGTNISYGSSTPNEVLASGFEDQEVSAEICGAAPGTTYHYRVVAQTTDGTDDGTDQEFRTELAPPVVHTEAATPVTDNTATLKGGLNPGGEATYYFEYGTSACEASTCGTKTSPEGGPLTGATEQAVSVELTGLKSNTTYHYWAVAANSSASGGVHGEAMEFTTPKSAEELAKEEEAAATAKKQQEQEATQKLIEEHAKQVSQETAAKEAAALAAKKKQEDEATAAAAKKKQEEEAANAKIKPLTRAQKLAKALRACKKEPKKERVSCEKLAKKKYGAAGKKANKKGKGK
jgi:DNA-binding beta-propeller fold protein YncE